MRIFTSASSGPACERPRTLEVLASGELIVNRQGSGRARAALFALLGLLALPFLWIVATIAVPASFGFVAAALAIRLLRYARPRRVVAFEQHASWKR